MAWPVVAVVALGGALGAGARYAVTSAWPGAVPWVTIAINVTGCLLIGVVSGRFAARPLLRPFLTTGVCGGFTTFSAFAVQTLSLSGLAAAGYLIATVAGSVGAAWLGDRLGTRP